VWVLHEWQEQVQKRPAGGRGVGAGCIGGTVAVAVLAVVAGVVRSDGGGKELA